MLATRVQAVSIMPDEAIFAVAGRSFWRTGHFLLLDAHAPFYGVYTLLAGLPLALWGPVSGLTVLKLVQALVVSTTAVWTYAWARRLTGAWWSFAAAAATAALPSLGYSGLIMSEALYLPVVTLALLAMASALHSPTHARQGLSVAALLFAALVRVQGLVLVPTFVLAVFLLAWFARDTAVIRRFAASFALLAIGGAVLAALYLAGVFSRPLGAYTPVAQSHYHIGSVALWIVRHAGDTFLLVLGIPLIATLLLGLQAVRGAETNASVAATLAVVLAYMGLLVVQVGIYASEFVGQLGERYLITLAPPVFVVFVVWLARGMPRPQPSASIVAAAVALPALTLPTHRLVTQFGTIDAFMIVPMLRLREHSSLITLQILWTVLVVTFTVLALVLPRRSAPALAAGVVCVLLAASGFAARDLETWTHAERTFLFGKSDLRWIDHATTQNVLYLYGGDPYWNRVWQTAFWNERVVAAAALPTDARLGRDLVSGSLPGKTAAELAADGHVLYQNGRAPPERLVVAFDNVELVGRRVPVPTMPPRFNLWRTDGAPVVTLWTQGLSADREIRDLATVTVPACRSGALAIGLAGSSETRMVDLSVDGSPVEPATVRPGASWRGAIPAPSTANGSAPCVFGLQTPDGVRLDQVDYIAGKTPTTPSRINPSLLGVQVAYCLQGTFTELLYRQPTTDPAYRGATPARFVEGKGLTCDPPPAGYRRRGLATDAMHVPAGFYPYYAP